MHFCVHPQIANWENCPHGFASDAFFVDAQKLQIDKLSTHGRAAISLLTSFWLITKTNCSSGQFN